MLEPPISELGFDPILCMPTIAAFRSKVQNRTCPIKALLLNQSFSAGVGNWVADEILYHAHIHPEERCNGLTDEQIEKLHEHTSEVCRIAVEVNADDSKFPDDWLFKHRWVNYNLHDVCHQIFTHYYFRVRVKRTRTQVP